MGGKKGIAGSKEKAAAKAKEDEQSKAKAAEEAEWAAAGMGAVFLGIEVESAATRC
jgi:hypothetical protein